MFIGFLAARVPDFQKTFSELVELFVKTTTGVMFSSLEQTNELMDRFERDRPGTKPIDRQRLFEFLQTKEYGVETRRNYVLATMLQIAVAQAALFSQMNWFAFRAPNRTSFVLSDNPLSIVPPRNRSELPWYGTGILTPGVAKLVPLGPRVCLVIGEPGDTFQYVDAGEAHTRDANLLATSHADRFVFARDERHLKSLVRATGIAQRERGPRIAFS